MVVSHALPRTRFRNVATHNFRHSGRKQPGGGGFGVGGRRRRRTTAGGGWYLGVGLGLDDDVTVECSQSIHRLEVLTFSHFFLIVFNDAHKRC
jgi:hypothetical protein